MNPSELAFGVAVVLLLFGLAGFFTWRQVQTLRKVRTDASLGPDDRGYLQAQARRRLFCSGLMVVLACLLIGSYFFEAEYQVRTQRANDRPTAAGQPALAPGDSWFLNRFTLYWIFALLVLFLFGAVAVLDVRATLRYGLAKHRQLERDHLDALQDELQRLRRERNGH